jgi:hypothetical protein
MEKVYFVELIAIKNHTYTVYIFKNLKKDEYIMCTRMPNWKTPELALGEKGYAQILYVKAGETYFNPVTNQKTTYNYSNVYFKNFIKESVEIKNKSEIIL